MNAEPRRVVSEPVASLTDGVREYLPEVRARARETELARRPLQETVDLVKRLNIVRAMVPKAYGGLEHDVVDWLQSIRALSSADMSAGWFAGLASAHSYGVSQFDKRVQDEVWGTLGPDAIVASASANTEGGLAVPHKDGFRLSGRWRFSSGVTAADWSIIYIRTTDPKTGDVQPNWAILPKSDYVIEDTWHTSGMRGSGSHDMVLNDAFLPAYRVGKPGIDMPSSSEGHYTNPLFKTPFLVMFPIIFAPIALGGVEGAIELYRQLVSKRKTAMTGVSLLDSPLTHLRLGEVAMRARALALMAEDRWRSVADHIAADQPMSPETQMMWRVTDAHVGHEAMRVVEQIIEGSGASVYFESNPLQRFWRDLHSTGGHTWFNTDSAFQVLGRQMLGLPRDPTLV